MCNCSNGFAIICSGCNKATGAVVFTAGGTLQSTVLIGAGVEFYGSLCTVSFATITTSVAAVYMANASSLTIQGSTFTNNDQDVVVSLLKPGGMKALIPSELFMRLCRYGACSGRYV